MSLGRHQPRPLTTRRYLGRQLHPRHLTAVRTTQLMQPIFIHQRLDFRQLHSSGGISGLGHLGSSESIGLRLPNQIGFFTVFFLSPVNGYRRPNPETPPVRSDPACAAHAAGPL
jgi:hypothetical protein